MSYDLWLFAIGIPAIAWLAGRAMTRARLLRERIAAVQAELRRSPPAPHQAMADLFSAAAQTPAGLPGARPCPKD